MRKNLESFLGEELKLTKEVIEDIFQRHPHEEQLIPETLYHLGILKEEDMFRIYEQVYQMKIIDIDSYEIQESAVSAISHEMASKYSVFPFQYREGQLCILTAHPQPTGVYEELKFITRKPLLFYLESKKQISYLISKHYGEQHTKHALEALNRETRQRVSEAVQINTESMDVLNAPAIRYVDSLFSDAICENASDIHFEPFPQHVLVRFRIDGTLYKIKELTVENYKSVCTRIKIMSNLDIDKRHLPQDGKIQHISDGKSYDLRISTLPTIYGEKIVIRILYKNSQHFSLEELGFQKEIEVLLHHPHGLILVTGPTGSGKSTTLYAMLHLLDRYEKNIVTIEDPVEYELYGINQVNVNYKIGFDFVQGLRSILRQDPDILLIGEIRDEETAHIAVRAAITGHLVLATLHTNNAVNSVFRLMDMKIPSYLIADALIAVISQRLVKKICLFCKQPSSRERIEHSSNVEGNGPLQFEGVGCGKCKRTGYSGRTAVYEVMQLRSEHRRIIESGGSAESLKKTCIAHGMIPIREQCMQLVREGVTSIEEIEKVMYGDENNQE